DGDAPGTLRRVTAVITHRGEAVRGGAFIFATGGTARPETGSTGDAFPWLQRLGVAVRAAESSLVPLRVPDRWVRELQGLALTDAELIVQGAVTAVGKGIAAPGARDGGDSRRGKGKPPAAAAGDPWANGKRLLTRRGKLLFTHFGLSGPLALNAAQDIRELAREGRIRLLVNPLPGTDPGTIDRQILDGVARTGNRKIVSLLGDLLPPRLARQICAVAGVPEDQRLASLSRVQRRQIVSVVTAVPCTFQGLMGTDKAVVSSGGVDPGEVDFRTMRLRRVSNAYVLGDLLDFNRSSGGYSLQICWAGGWVAGSTVGGQGKG
ncbi:MAG: NAD(P)/FAD-dependent oxidoreductase, partial [Alkalispirochaeta sp.]